MNVQKLLDNPLLPDVELVGLSEHTSEVRPGYGYLGVAANDGTLGDHCRNAIGHGACAILCDAPQFRLPEEAACPVVQVPGLASRRGELAARFYGDPSADLTCAGVTGTNGKTSVAYHIADLSERLGAPMGYCGTLGWGDLQHLHEAEMTTANAVALQRRLSAMRDAGLCGVALEVSSHALDQRRTSDLHFDYAVFTNLSRDHLDYHGTYAAYSAAKTKLFTDWPLQKAVINVDDEFGLELARKTTADVVTYGAGGDWRWQVDISPAGMAVNWHTPHGGFTGEVQVAANYAIANITAAMATLVAMGHTMQDVAAQLPALRSVPGRMEIMKGHTGQARVVVDYAHTPDALQKVLAALRPFCTGKLICVVGCGGDRDAGKRPWMGHAAAVGADVAWFTSDNPRSETPADIIADIQAGVPSGASAQVHVCVDRAEAIHGALSESKKGDVVLVAGKGHESYQEIDGRRLPFDDRLVVARVLQELS